MALLGVLGSVASPLLAALKSATQAQANKPLEKATSVDGTKSYYDYGNTGGSYTTGASNPLDSSAATPSRSDELWAAVDASKARKASDASASIDTSTPQVPQISWDDALSQAKGYFEPQYDSAVMSQNKLASDQQKRLTQALAARGYANARGGHRQVGEGDISQSHAMALDNLRNQYDSQIGKYAMEIYSGRANDAYNNLRTLLADRDAKNQLALQQYGLDLNAGLQREQMESNRLSDRYNSIWNLAMLLAGEE